jgi:hypothetical protein
MNRCNEFMNYNLGLNSCCQENDIKLCFIISAYKGKRPEKSNRIDGVRLE